MIVANFPCAVVREAEAAAGTALPSGSPEPDGLDVERLAQALRDGPNDVDHIKEAKAIAAEYARLAGEDSK